MDSLKSICRKIILKHKLNINILPKGMKEYCIEGRKRCCPDTFLEKKGGYPPTDDFGYEYTISATAIKKGHLECLKNIYKAGRLFYSQSYNGIYTERWYNNDFETSPEDDLCPLAASYGQLECLKYLKKIGFVYDSETIKAASVNGQLECIKYLTELGITCESDALGYAAKYGHLECLKYLHEHRNPLDWDTFYIAVEDRMPWWPKHSHPVENQMKCIKYLHANNCPWNEDVFTRALLYENKQIIKYLFDNQCPYNVESYPEIQKALE